jgi:hypothetical protein
MLVLSGLCHVTSPTWGVDNAPRSLASGAIAFAPWDFLGFAPKILSLMGP